MDLKTAVCVCLETAYALLLSCIVYIQSLVIFIEFC